jgi:hypothetical protein
MFCHSSTSTRALDLKRLKHGIGLAFALLVGCVAAACAETPADDALTSAAREILAAHCPPCNEVGLRARSGNTGEPPQLDLAAIARDPNLVRPGNPDGSPVYTTLVRRLLTSPTSPSAEQLATLRSWIASLPASAANCPISRDMTRGTIEQRVVRHAVKSSTPVAALRVLSFAHIDGGCVPVARLAAWRRAIGLFLAALAGSTKPAAATPIDESGNLIAIDIRALGWDADLWRTLTGVGPRPPRSTEPLMVRADWLIVHVLRGPLGTRAANLSTSPPHKPRSFYDPEITPYDRAIVEAMLSHIAPRDELAQRVESVIELARSHLAPAGLSQVAAELGVERRALDQRFDGVATGLVARLAYGTVPRSEIEDGWAQIAKAAGVTPPVKSNVPSQADTAAPDVALQLYADRLRYKVGDEIRFTVRSNVDCRLHVISIDVSGHGTVIFPNDFVQNDQISAGIDVTLPAPSAGYRFRVKERGRERVVALCTRAPGAIDGITHDFERQRFQELGIYATFLDSALRNALKRRADGEDGGEHAPLHEISRTGIVIEVE